MPRSLPDSDTGTWPCSRTLSGRNFREKHSRAEPQKPRRRGFELVAAPPSTRPHKHANTFIACDNGPNDWTLISDPWTDVAPDTELIDVIDLSGA